jgi:hypothetical protein
MLPSTIGSSGWAGGAEGLTVHVDAVDAVATLAVPRDVQIPADDSTCEMGFHKEHFWVSLAHREWKVVATCAAEQRGILIEPNIKEADR